ncbi:hypothetical protein QEL93_003335 [Pseudomonas putida]|nr:hypothetical protein [Pseudomonas putida]
MSYLDSRYSDDTRDGARPLILAQRTSAQGPDTPILFQQSCLGLAQDQARVVLRRYFECYSPEGGHWVEYVHSIPTADFIQWIMTHGQLQVACSDDTPDIASKVEAVDGWQKKEAH